MHNIIIYVLVTIFLSQESQGRRSRSGRSGQGRTKFAARGGVAHSNIVIVHARRCWIARAGRALCRRPCAWTSTGKMGNSVHSDTPSEEGPHQPWSLNFPSRQFGKSKVVSRSFQSKWFDKYKWLHYDEAQDAAYCYTCRTANGQNKLKSKYKDSAFITRGFTNWKDGTSIYSVHLVVKT